MKNKEKDFEKKIENLIKENEKLEKEKNEKETLTNSNTGSNFYPPTKKENTEETVKELEKKIRELDDEKIERETYFKDFVEEMSTMMMMFEQKAQEIIRHQNNQNSGCTTHPQRKLEINTGGGYENSNPCFESGCNDTIKGGNNGKKGRGGEQNTGIGGSKTTSGGVFAGGEGRPQSKNKNKKNNNTNASTNIGTVTHNPKGNESNNKEIFINYTDNFGNKV